MDNGPYGYDGARPPMLPVRDPGAFGWQDEPLTNYIGNVIKSYSHIPLWNPNMGLGYPILAGTQEGIFFPLNYINFLFSSEWSWNVFFLIRIFLAGFFTYAFARKIGIEKISSCVSAIIFMFSGYTIEYLNMAHFSTEALIPLALLATEYFLEKRSVRSFLLYAMVLALTILPGMPESTFFVFLISFLWFIFSLLSLHPEINKKEKWRSVSLGILANVTALLLTAIQLLPFLELLKNSINTHSGGITGLYSASLSFSFSLFSPFISNPALNWVGGTISYIGISAFILSILALLSYKSFSTKQKRIVLFFSIFIFFMLAKCYGLFFINWIGNLPILNTLIFPKYAVPSVIFSVSIAAGFGLSALIKKEVRRINLKVFCALAIVIASFFYMLYENAGLFATNVKIVSPVYLILTLSIALVIALMFWLLMSVFSSKRKNFPISILIMVFVFLEFYAYGLPLQRADRYDTYKEAPYLDFLEKEAQQNGEVFRIYAQSAQKVQPSVLYPNISSVFGLQDVRFVLGLGVKRYFEFMEKELGVPIEEINTNRFTGDYPISLDNKYMDLLNVKYFIVPKDSKVSDSIGTAVYNNEVEIIENKDYLPRTFVVQKATVSSQDDVFDKLNAAGFNPEKEIIIEGKATDELSRDQNGTSTTANSKATIIKYSDQQVDIEVQTDESGYLVLLDQYYPGWKAFVDGKETEIFPTDYVFRSVYISKGDHEVEFIYDPVSYEVGKLISGFVLFVLIILLFSHRIKLFLTNEGPF